MKLIFERCADLFSKLADDLFRKNQRESIPIQENTSDEATEPQISGNLVRVGNEIHLLKESVDRYYPEQDKGYRLQGKTFWLTLGTLLAACTAAFFTFRQWQTMNRTYGEIQRQTYMACLNVQAAQAMFIQAQNSAGDSHAMAVSAVQQSAAEINTTKALISFTPRFPRQGEFFESKLGIPYSVKNDGKSAAIDLEVRSAAVLLQQGEVFRPSTDQLKLIGQAKYFPSGGESPEKPSQETPYRPSTLSIKVLDLKGQAVPAPSQVANKFMEPGGTATVFVYAHISYSDFSGIHKERFCQPLALMKTGTTHQRTPSELICAQYNQIEDQYSSKPTISVPAKVAPLPPVKCPPPPQ
jgi:hypothetical protein